MSAVPAKEKEVVDTELPKLDKQTKLKGKPASKTTKKAPPNDIKIDITPSAEPQNGAVDGRPKSLERRMSRGGSGMFAAEKVCHCLLYRLQCSRD